MASAYLGVDYYSETPRSLLEMIEEWRRIEWNRDKQKAQMTGNAMNGGKIPDYPEEEEQGGAVSSFYL